MKRLIWLALIVALALTAAALREPETTLVTFRPNIIAEGQEAAAGVWYCPWLQSSFERAGSVVAAATVPATASFTFPNPEPGQEADTVSLDVAGPGAVALTMTDVAVRGSVPGFVEFSEGPSGAGVLIESDTTVSADSCIASQPKIWYLTGGSTAQDESLTLRLFNPFPEVSIVTAAAVSEFGPEPLPDFDAIPVPPRSFVDLTLDEELRLRESISVTVIAAEGIVIPAFAIANPEDEAFWTGTGLSTRWEFPVVRGGAIEPQLALTNPGTAAATIEIDVFTPDGPTLSARSEVIAPETPLLISLGDLSDSAFGIRVRSDEAIAATVVAKGGGLAGTTGVSQPSNRWLAPGAGAAVDGVTSLWVMNSGDEPATATVQPLSTSALAVDKIALPPGTIRQVIVEDPDSIGYLIDSLTPISIAWSVRSDEGIAFSSAIAVAP